LVLTGDRPSYKLSPSHKSRWEEFKHCQVNLISIYVTFNFKTLSKYQRKYCLVKTGRQIRSNLFAINLHERSY
jgi:hypothetical protein